MERCPEQCRMIIALGHQQHVVIQILVNHVPGVVGVAGDTTDAQTLALTYRVVHQSLVGTEAMAVQVMNLAGLRG